MVTTRYSAANERAWVNPDASSWIHRPAPDVVTTFHRGMGGYRPTGLVDLPAMAAGLGVARVFAKDESARFGLPAFKVLGVSWAVVRALGDRYGLKGELTLETIQTAAGTQPPVTLVTATDGNHGRALARMAALVGLPSTVVVPAGLPAVTVAAIRSEGAAVIELDATYDDAVAHAAEIAREREDRLLVQDTAWPGYERIPAWIVEGYATLLREVDDRLAAAGAMADIVAIPTGVGSLLQAAVTHYRRAPHGTRTAVLAVEPVTAACVLASVRAGQATTVPTPGTVMNGLNCGTPSSLAWPVVRDGLDAAVAVTDDAARVAMRDLATAGVAAGPSGAASLAGVRELLGNPALVETMTHSPRTGLTVVLFCTEGLAATTSDDD
ncbi:MAG TPA: diaminopropionate ammonia-lyase [Thermomicrobiales bacterium]|jgi:diaminopropionate ammonia-lyase|nr:diaminopropionate ammonia-lyase [Thermomicrobiales bacterium]